MSTEDTSLQVSERQMRVYNCSNNNVRNRKYVEFNILTCRLQSKSQIYTSCIEYYAHTSGGIGCEVFLCLSTSVLAKTQNWLKWGFQ